MRVGSKSPSLRCFSLGFNKLQPLLRPAYLTSCSARFTRAFILIGFQFLFNLFRPRIIQIYCVGGVAVSFSRQFDKLSAALDE